MVEKVVLKGIMETRGNLFNVPEKKWIKWTPQARQVFNEVYSAMSKNQELFLHPHAEKLSRRFWRTTSYNAAWIAADAVK